MAEEDGETILMSVEVANRPMSIMFDDNTMQLLDDKVSLAVCLYLYLI
jgi:hypothetical protein